MTRISLKLGAALAALTLWGCGGGGSSAPSGSTSGVQVAEGPELTAQQQAAGITAYAPYVITDRSGWGAPMPQSRILVPSGWRVASDVLWFTPGGPCGPGLAEPVIQMTSPDGRSAIEISAPMQIASTQLAPGNMPPEMQPLVQAQAQEMQNAMARTEQEYRQRGDGCHVGPVGSAQEIAQRYVLRYRRPNSRVLQVRPLPQTQASLQAMVQQITAALGAVPNVQTFVDAAVVDMETPGPDGVMAAERMNFGVIATRYTMPGMSMVGGGSTGGSTFDSLNTTPIVSIRAPRDQFSRVEAMAATVLASLRVNPQWQEAINQLNMEISRIRAQGSRDTLQAMARRGQIAAEARARAGDERLRAWYADQDAGDRRQAAFIDRIYDSTGFINPATGQRMRVPYGQTAFSNGQGGFATGPVGSSPGPGWSAMQPAPTS